ncbi:Mitochondrial import receptor subunit TOM20 like protein [Pteropus alecto]|uniref:Mitochondrial import receptor subunit TOM20 like protein n=1 Tax=Pteropus alecto TaxID=9402 RepID=L5K2W2_PTEAL|nr:Mitochondrial import receptor subunit TOM20 like protein [Pteropus alecto]
MGSDGGDIPQDALSALRPDRAVGYDNCTSEYEKGVDHLTNAIAVCGQPQQLLQVLQQTLPPPVFQMLLTKLPTISQRIVSAQSLAEDDVE